MRRKTKAAFSIRDIARATPPSLHGSRSRWPPSSPCKCISRGLLGAALLHVKTRACSQESAAHKRDELEFKYFLPQRPLWSEDATKLPQVVFEGPKGGRGPWGDGLQRARTGCARTGSGAGSAERGCSKLNWNKRGRFGVGYENEV